jgi:hypothetical protein
MVFIMRCCVGFKTLSFMFLLIMNDCFGLGIKIKMCQIIL